MFICERCNAAFPKSQGLACHKARKNPCTPILETPDNLPNRCGDCGRTFSTQGNLDRHIRKTCMKNMRNRPVEDQITMMQTKIAELEQRLDSQKTNSMVVNESTLNTINGPVTVVNNNVKLEMAPWGSPLTLTDADVEAALARIPGVAGTPALSEIVDVLMDLVKRAHIPPEARNVYLNPRRGDQALACTPDGAWATLPLTEATRALFDGASIRMASPTNKNTTMRASLPVHYRQDKANAVQLGLRPMEAHLANLAPGGPGPLMIAVAQPAPTQPIILLDPDEIIAAVNQLKATNELTPDWLLRMAQDSKMTVNQIAAIIWRAAPHQTTIALARQALEAARDNLILQNSRK